MWLSVMSDSAPLCTVAHQAPLSIGFSRQEDWSGLPFPLPGNLPDPGMQSAPHRPLALQMDFIPLSLQGLIIINKNHNNQ